MHPDIRMFFTCPPYTLMDISTEILSNELRNASILPSPQRLAVYRFLKSNPVHPTAETIWNAIRTDFPSVSLTTVYNTLKVLVNAGLIREVPIENGELRYDADLRRHAHFKCSVCGKVMDLFQVLPPEKLTLPDGMEVLETHLFIKGICADCRGKK